jgi:putative amide transporter protein
MVLFRPGRFYFERCTAKLRRSDAMRAALRRSRALILRAGGEAPAAKRLEAFVTYLCLFFVGSVYLLNGLGLLGRVEAKASAPLNLFIGAILLVLTGRLIFPVLNPTPADMATVFAAAGELLFAFTFLYVGILNYTGHNGSGLGWFCGWGAIVSAGLSLAWLLALGDPRSACLWMVWSVVFAAFFALMILKTERLTRATGWFLLVAGFTTCLAPGALMALELWNSIPVWAIAAAEFGAIGVFVALAALSGERFSGLAKGPATAGAAA